MVCGLLLVPRALEILGRSTLNDNPQIAQVLGHSKGSRTLGRKCSQIHVAIDTSIVPLDTDKAIGQLLMTCHCRIIISGNSTHLIAIAIDLLAGITRSQSRACSQGFDGNLNLSTHFGQCQRYGIETRRLRTTCVGHLLPSFSKVNERSFVVGVFTHHVATDMVEVKGGSLLGILKVLLQELIIIITTEYTHIGL